MGSPTRGFVICGAISACSVCSSLPTQRKVLCIETPLEFALRHAGFDVVSHQMISQEKSETPNLSFGISVQTHGVLNVKDILNNKPLEKWGCLNGSNHKCCLAGDG